MDEEFEEFWIRNTEILLKFCNLFKTDKAGFKKNVYDEWRKYDMVKVCEPKLEKIFKQCKTIIHERFGQGQIR